MNEHLEKLMEGVNTLMSKFRYGETPEELYEPIRYIMALGGKRLRPMLTILGGGVYGKDIVSLFHPALGVEIFHNFTLMHDDIMDKAPLRRGKPTVHHKWDESVAILSGDVMLVKAYEVMMQVPDVHLRTVLKMFNRCATEVCEGQQLDMNFEKLDTVTEDEYLEMIRLKTAVLLGFALALGAVLADAPQTDIDLLSGVGEFMGIGFQLKDDLLDVFGEAGKVGKQVGGDIIANKKTFLLIEALARAEGEQRKTLEYWLQVKDFVPEEKVQAVTQIYRELDIDKLTEQKMQEYFKMSHAFLDRVSVPEKNKAVLRGFMEWLMAREH
ncbi:MAG: polyprenyl synthetase family protein [Bacteroidetes bacterium]|nr:MAG: polyprenyl synthetase family protein [Bacteroidota bacterium]